MNKTFPLYSSLSEEEQKEIFDKALHHMKIYDDSKTFIVDSEIEAVVADVKAILKKAAPFHWRQLHRLFLRN